MPDYETLMHPLLSRLADEQIRVVKDVVAQLADEFKLTLEERAQLLPSGGTLTFASRVGWAKTYLKKAGLVQQPKRGLVQITDQGKAALAQQPVRIDVGFLEQFSSFLDFRNSSREKPISTRLNDVLPLPSDLTPDEVIEAAYQRSISALADEVLERVKACSPIYFERLVVQLLIQMGYGGSREEAGKAVGRSGDGGIDGVINEDRLGMRQEL